MTCRKLNWRRNRDGRLTRDKAQQIPVYWLGDARHKGGVSPTQALMWNVRTCRTDAKQRAQADSLGKSASSDAVHRGGATRSSDDADESRSSKGVALTCQRHWSTESGMSW
jgi:hypothetical protein